MTTRAGELFDLARDSLHMLCDELAAHGVQVDHSLELRRGEGLLCHYDLEDGNIYLSVPDAERSRGKFELLVFRAVSGLDTDEKVMRLLELVIPWLIGHELAHHLRHRFGLLGTDVLEEERIANWLASTFAKRQLTVAQKQELLHLLSPAITSLSGPLASFAKSAGVNTAHDPVRHVFYHLQWLYLDLTKDLTKEEETSTADFVEACLGQSR